MRLNCYPVHKLRNMLMSRQISAEELCIAFFTRIDAVEDKLKAYVTLMREDALKKAREVDRQISAGEELPFLGGIPIAVKDNLCTKGIRTTCSSKMLYNFIPPYSATVIKKLNAAKAVILGKTNMDEFAMGSSTENSAFFPTSNPWDTNRVPGGSSGGSAVAVAAGEAVAALGSDTGGSIRQPASFCSVVGLKPTYGRVSRYGLVAFASSLDQVGSLTRDVTDCAGILNVIAGHDPLDSTSVPGAVPDYNSYLKNNVKGLKIGVPKEYMDEGISSEVRQIIEQAIVTLSGLGAEIEETSLPHSKYALPAYCLIATAEASSNLARYDGVRYGYRAEGASDVVDMYIKTRSHGFGAEVKRRIMLGTYALSAGYYDAYYLKAQQVRTLIKQDFDRVFEKYDALLSPTTPYTAFIKGEKIDDPIKLYMSDICTLSLNLAGVPGLSIPAGFVDGLPVGLQLIGKSFDEGTLLRIAYTFEQNTDFHKKRPEI